jgi:hypothetical protein
MPDEILTHDQASELYERLAREAAARNSRARRVRVAGMSGLSIALLAALALGAGFVAGWGDRSEQRKASYPTLHALKSSASPEAIRKANVRIYGIVSPCRGGVIWAPRLKCFGDEYAVAVTLNEALERARFHVRAPSKALPDSSIEKVWLRTTGPFPDVVAIEYGHLEIIESTGSWPRPSDYRRWAGEPMDPGAHLGSVQGETAYVVPPQTDKDGIPHPGYIDFVKDDVRVMVEGYYSEDELLLIANSLE